MVDTRGAGAAPGPAPGPIRDKRPDPGPQDPGVSPATGSRELLFRPGRIAAAPPPGGAQAPDGTARSRVRARIFWDQVFPYLALGGLGLLVAVWLRSRLPVPLGKLGFVQPWALLLLLVVPLLCWVSFHLGQRRRGTFLFSRLADCVAVGTGILARLHTLPAVLRILALAGFALALARPQSHHTVSHEEKVEGIDIVLALDVSLSMSARDLSSGIFGAKTRLDVAKEVIDDFIRQRRNDRVGLVLFGREAYTWCPPTLDYQALRTLLADVKLGIVNGQATAIGDALGTAINRLRRSKASSRVIILLTDGDNNSGSLTPNQAANYAATFKIKVFTVLVGRDVGGQGGIFGHYRAAVNPRLLEQIAALTGGTPYLATDDTALKERFQRILDSLKKDVRVRKEHKPAQHWLLFFWPALFLFLAELGLRFGVQRRFP